jgi:hypothetical protein
LAENHMYGYGVIRSRSVCDMFGGSHSRRPLEAFL